MKGNKTVKYAIEVLSIIAGVVIAFFLKPTEALSAEALKVLGIFVWGVINLIIALAPSYVIGLVMAMLWFATKAVGLSTIFSGFAGSTWWLIVGVMGLGAAVKNSGLLKRLSLYSLKWFKPTYTGQVLALVVMGLLIASLIPSTTAKCAIMGSLALGISDELDLPKKGKGRFGLLLALWLGFNISGNVFINASFQGYMVLGILPEATQATYTWMTWFIRCLPWTIVLFVTYFLYIKTAFREETTKVISKEYIDQQFKELGSLKRDEKITAAVMAVALVLFIFEQKTGIGSVVVSVLGMCVLTFTGVIGPKEFINNTLWPLVVFIGIALGFGAVFNAVGISSWMVGLLTPLTTGLNNPYLFVVVIALITYVIRFFVDQITVNTVLIAVLYPLAEKIGIDPWIACIVVYHCSIVFYPLYVHPNMMICLGALGGEENIETKHFAPADFVFMALNLVALLACVPVWHMFGMC